MNDDQLGLIVHSYNNFLSGIMGFTELALMESEQVDVKQRLEMAMDSANESVLFGQALLSSVSRLQVKMDSHDVGIILQAMQKSLEQAHANLNKSPALKLIIKAPKQNLDKLSLKVKTNPQWLTHCLTSLVQFITDYFKADEVIIELEQKAESVVLTLPVNGKLDQQDSDQLFEPFYSSRNLLGQKCVGLAMLAGFLKQIQGSIRWQNDKGFVIEIASTQ